MWRGSPVRFLSRRRDKQPHRNPPLPPQIQQAKIAEANSKPGKTWGQGQGRERNGSSRPRIIKQRTIESSDQQPGGRFATCISTLLPLIVRALEQSDGTRRRARQAIPPSLSRCARRQLGRMTMCDFFEWVLAFRCIVETASGSRACWILRDSRRLRRRRRCRPFLRRQYHRSSSKR